MESKTVEVVQTGIVSAAVVIALLGLLLLANDCKKIHNEVSIEESKIQLEHSKAAVAAKGKFLIECAAKHTPAECTLMWRSR